MNYTTKGHRVDDLSAPDEKGCRRGVVIWEDVSGIRATNVVFADNGVCISHLESDWRLAQEEDNVVYLSGRLPEKRIFVDYDPAYHSPDSFTCTFERNFHEFIHEQVPPEIEADFFRDLLTSFYQPSEWRNIGRSQRRFIQKVVVNAAVKAAVNLLPKETQDD